MSLPMRIFGDPTLYHQALLLAERLSLSAAYDAHYLALAERLEADFWTCDRKLYNTIHGRFGQIHLATVE